MAIAKVHTETLHEQLVSVIRKKILTGELKAGDRVVESDIATELGISRGPIREALRNIERDGLVTYSQNKGCKVRKLAPDDAWEIFYLRCNLELLALQLCDGKIPEMNLKKMRQVLNKMERAKETADVNAFLASDEEFHKSIVKSGGMEKLLVLWSSLNGLNCALFLTEEVQMVNLEVQCARHQKLYETLIAGDFEKSGDMISQHYLDTRIKIYQRIPEELKKKNEKIYQNGGSKSEKGNA